MKNCRPLCETACVKRQRRGTHVEAWGSVQGFVARKKALAPKARFTGDVIRDIIGRVFISRGYFFGLRTITELESRFQRLVTRMIGFLGRCPRLTLAPRLWR
jgi:hypothetical protein